MPPVHVWQYAWQIASAHLWHTTEYSDLFWLLDSYRRYQENSYDLKKPFHTALKWLLWTVDINCWNKLLAAKSMQAIMKANPSKIRMSSSNLPWGKKKPHTHTKNPTLKPSNNPILRSNGFGTRFSTFLSFLISFKCCLLQTLYLWLHNPWIHAKHTLLFYSKQAIHIQNTSKNTT